jgi:F-type H+-transporting ATPase subunit a
MKLHVSISAEPIFHLGKFAITNSMFTGVIVSALLVGFSVWLNKNLEKKKVTKGIQNAVEMIIEALYNLMISITGEKKARVFFPLVTTFFLFILVSNWLGLLPGVGTIGILAEAHDGDKSFTPLIRPPSADINATIALALISVIMTQVTGFRYLKARYLLRFFNFKSPMKFFQGFLELISEASKIISFAFRLFGNIFAGEVLLTVSLALLPFLAPLPFIGLEIFVGIIQAFVFAILTLVFMNIATIPHDEEH